jgi:cell shape-determining protein MreC
MAVLSAEKVFFGQVTHAGEQVSEVRTASDPQWELSVRVGPNEVDALFVGGRTPRLTLIANAGDVLPGDPIYLAAPGMPYGLLVGYVANVEEDTHHSFKEASVTLPHAHVQVVEVLILTR